MPSASHEPLMAGGWILLDIGRTGVRNTSVRKASYWGRITHYCGGFVPPCRCGWAAATEINSCRVPSCTPSYLAIHTRTDCLETYASWLPL